jgi:hypothetical protein
MSYEDFQVLRDFFSGPIRVILSVHIILVDKMQRKSCLFSIR